VWEVPQPLDRVIHTMGWPLRGAKKFREFGGSFIYPLGDNMVALGMVVGLDYMDATLSVHDLLQELKLHPFVRKILMGGKRVAWGAKTIPEGGFLALPDRFHFPGGMIAGDGAGLVNVPALKGIHYAMRSGMLAAEFVAATNHTQGWDAALRGSVIVSELKKVRNIRPGFHKGFWLGLANAGWETVSAGHSPWTLKNHGDAGALRKFDSFQPALRDYVERTLPPRDRLAEVYFASTQHDEDQPIHLHVADTNICVTKCAEEYKNPCTRFCPAGVYEIVGDGADKRLQINSANCVHCKTCDIKDPYGIINWVTPEGGSGPNYQNL